MQKPHCSHVCAWAVVLLSACATPPTNLTTIPQVAPSQGLAIGHFQIFIRDREVTPTCTLTLWDTASREISVTPPASGWVFAPVQRGSVRISSVDCGAKTALATLDFHVPSDGRPTYFGHIRLQLPEPEKSYTQNSEAIGAGMRAAPPTLTGAVVATAVGLLATALLATPVAAGPAKVEVEDKSAEAAALYAERSRQSPNTLVASLAGSVVLDGPSLSPAVQKAGDIVYTEATLGGVRLTWLAASEQGQRKAAVRLQRFIRKDAPCTSAKFVVDGRELTVSTVSKSERASAMLKQTVQGDVDSQTIQDIAGSKRLLVDVCGTRRAFSDLARTATMNFAKAYSALPVSATQVADALTTP